MTPENFEFISSLVKSRSGLVLTEDKSYLLESRLMPVSRQYGLDGLDALINELRSKKDEKLIVQVTEALTTNESFFFRDGTPFEILKEDILPALMEARSSMKRLRIWCAAASSGQEPYSIAMVLKELGTALSGWQIEIIGTDISNDILDKARKGTYSQFEVQRGLPIQLLLKYFSKVEETWVIKDEIKNMVQFKYWNLLEDLSSLGAFDIVFCRNVLIYFDAETKSRVLANISGLMPRDGWLLLGGAETVLGISDEFTPVKGKRGTYELK